MDTNLIENSIRPIALGRNIYLFCRQSRYCVKHGDRLLIAGHLQAARGERLRLAKILADRHAHLPLELEQGFATEHRMAQATRP